MKVLVTNIPVRGFLEGYVDVADGLTGDELDKAVREKLEVGHYEESIIEGDAGNGVYSFEVEDVVSDPSYELNIIDGNAER